MAEPAGIIVATHPRSGTHFAINALCLNLRDLRFAPIRGQYPSLERLLLDHDAAYTAEWEEYLRGPSGAIPILKTHLTPLEIERVLAGSPLAGPREDAIVRRAFETFPVVCVHRDGRDVMVSWFHYVCQFGGGLPADTPARLRQCTFAEFLRMPNRHLPPVRGAGPEDLNRPRYWRHHVERWLDRPGTVGVAYEDLHGRFDETVRGLAASLGLEHRLLPRLERPPLAGPARGPMGRCLRALRRRADAARQRITRGVRFYPPSPAWARQGGSGGWRGVFGDDDLAFFLGETEPLMRRLGHLPSTPGTRPTPAAGRGG